MMVAPQWRAVQPIRLVQRCGPKVRESLRAALDVVHDRAGEGRAAG
jgi:hypothetical protein